MLRISATNQQGLRSHSKPCLECKKGTASEKDPKFFLADNIIPIHEAPTEIYGYFTSLTREQLLSFFRKLPNSPNCRCDLEAVSRSINDGLNGIERSLQQLKRRPLIDNLCSTRTDLRVFKELVRSTTHQHNPDLLPSITRYEEFLRWAERDDSLALAWQIMCHCEYAYYKTLRVVWGRLFKGYFSERPAGLWEELEVQQSVHMFDKAWEEFEELQKHFEAASAAEPILRKEEDVLEESKNTLLWRPGRA